MKKLILFLLIFLSYSAIAQVGINATGTAPAPSAMLDVSSTNKGVLIPRMTTAQKLAISNATEGLMVYDTDLKQFSYWSNLGWVSLGTSSNGGIPSTGIILSELNANSIILNAGFQFDGLTTILKYPSQPGYNWNIKLPVSYSGSPNVGHSAIWTGKEMIIWGGSTSITHVINTGDRYNFFNNNFLGGWNGGISTTIAPSARQDHTAIWTGTKMLIWGGVFISIGGTPSVRNDGGEYEPITDTWTVTETSGTPPSGRTGHTAIWTGIEMIIWGGWGVSPSPFINTGGRYTPTNNPIFSNPWTATSTVNAPVGRADHVALWTGSKMIIYGGVSNSLGAGLNTGGLYDPSTNTWTSISTVNAPTAIVNSGRTIYGFSRQGAVWTGTEMIVFSHDGTSQYAYRYNPTTNVWTKSAVGQNISSLVNYSIVWTGKAVIIFGGNSGTNIGYVYFPDTDTWLPSTIPIQSGAPLYGVGYTIHTAVWTGLDMIIYGNGIGHLMRPNFSTDTESKLYYLYKKN